MGHGKPTVTVFAPVLYLSVTVERAPERQVDEIHIHPAGQGFWIARMLRHVGERPHLCGPLGGESGQVINGLLRQWHFDFSPIHISDNSSVVVYDRRSGKREVFAQTELPELIRHEHDDAYGVLLKHALASGVCVITGQIGELFPFETYRRLGHDLAAGDVKVVTDMHGPELEAFLDGGPIEVLKISDEDLKEDGWLDDDGDEAALEVIDRLMKSGAGAVALSRSDRPVLARFGDLAFEAVPPQLEPADTRGAGDSMTAGLAAAVRRGHGPEESLRLACAAGAANITRRGLGSASSSLVPDLKERVEVRPLGPRQP